MILCCGEALIDFMPVSGENAYQPCPGGSIFNIAIGLGRLKTQVSFFSKISTDFFGDQLLTTLEENGVDASFCLRAPNPTTLAFVSLDAEEGSEPQFSFYANESADRSLSVDELPDRLPEEIKALHFGSISLVLQPGATALESLMAREYENRVISLDPNVRPNLIPDRDLYRQRFEKWLQSVDLLKLSRADRNWIYPDLDMEGCLERWFGLGVDLVLQTKGSKGAEAVSKNGESAYMETPCVEVVDTVGAGDSFMAATLTYLADQKLLYKELLGSLGKDQLSGLLKFASQAAAINCTRVGANPPFRDEL